MTSAPHASGTYEFLPGNATYSGGVTAAPGHRLVWASFRRPVPLAEGVERAAQLAATRGGGPDRLCALSLRSPAPMSIEAFEQFNREYRDLLTIHRVVDDLRSPIARSNVVPTIGTPTEVVLYGFGFAEPAETDDASFIISGAAELREQAAADDAIVRPGDVSVEGLREKAATVADALNRGLQGLNARWADVTAINVYTRENFVPLAADLFAPVGDGAVHGLRWFPSVPPVEGLDFEVDVRATPLEIVIE